MPDAGRRKQERYALPGLSLPPCAPLAGSFSQPVQKMVVFLIVSKRRFMTVLERV